MTQTINAEPVKGFFVDMITWDISLQDCIMDLIDNCIDGADKAKKRNNLDTSTYDGFKCEVSFSGENFTIKDNCGGITIDEAVNYAFYFGRRKTDSQHPGPLMPDNPIGLYGIGMKRAIFKLGRIVNISSFAETEGFTVYINVDDWLQIPDWKFELNEVEPDKLAGTTISVGTLRSAIRDEFKDRIFEQNLRREIARHYAFLISSGFEIVVNEVSVRPFGFRMREGGDFQPMRRKAADDGVDVEIIAGMAEPPPDDVDPEALDTSANNYGWYVICNKRVVLAADRTNRTVWGDDGFQIWHPQYNGFIGLLFLSSHDPDKLPWGTTKREIDETSFVYRRAVKEMKDVTRIWISYTTSRKDQIEEAKLSEQAVASRLVTELPYRPQLSFPTLHRTSLTTVQYKVLIDEMTRVKKALGSSYMSNADAGLRTFRYYLENEAE
jgi:hypothetical protein